jgi:hypothetical protein
MAEIAEPAVQTDIGHPKKSISYDEFSDEPTSEDYCSGALERTPSVRKRVGTQVTSPRPSAGRRRPPVPRQMPASAHASVGEST